MPSPTRWTGVRPVRYYREILAVLEHIATSPTDLEQIRRTLAQERENREKARLNVLLTRHSIKSSLRARPEFLTKAEQVLRFLKTVDLVDKKVRQITLTEEGRKLVELSHSNELAAQAYFLNQVLNSTYTTYLKFLLELAEKRLSIPISQSARGRESAQFLASRGFPLDSWSFYVLRDFFYDLSLLNYVYTESEERIFPLYSLIADAGRFTLNVKTPLGILWYWPKVSPTEFVDELTSSYLKLSGSWSRILDLVHLREEMSEEFHIPELQFNILLQEVLTNPSDFIIALSFGSLRLKPRKGYATKVMTLPKHQSGQPYTLIRIEPRVR